MIDLRKNVDVLAIGVTMHFHLENVQKLINAVCQATGTGNVKILLGGYIFKVDNTLWQTLGADGCAENAHEAIVLAKRLTAKENVTVSRNNTGANTLKPV